MSQACLRSAIAAFALASVSMPALAADSHDPEALAIWREAVDSHSRDYGLLHECTVTGEMRVTYVATDQKAQSDLSFQVKNNQLWMKLSVREDPGNIFRVPEKQVVCDGESITEASIPDCGRLARARIDIHKDDSPRFATATCSAIDPRIDLISQWFREDHSDKFDQRGALLSMEVMDGAPVIVLNEKDGKIRFWFDADCGRRLVRMESRREGTPPDYIYEYAYAKHGDFVVPKSIVMKRSPTRPNGCVYQMDIRTIVPGVDIKTFDRSAIKEERTGDLR